MMRSVIRGVGGYLPERVLTNHDLARRLDTSDEWITVRTGIKQRHVAAEGELTSDLATRAAERALASAGLTPADIDLILVATATPDQTFPATATTVQAKLGAPAGIAFDLQAVCSGFVYGLSVADSMLKTGMATSALVIGAETFTRILDWEDRTTCVLFGDGAGAVVLRAEPGEGTLADRGVLKANLKADGRFNDILYVDGGPSSTRTTGHLRMAGKEVFRHAVQKLSDAITDILADAGLSTSDIDLIVPHQANERILLAVVERLGIAPERVVNTVAIHGNTSAASIPLALDQAVRDGRVSEGDLLLFEGLGGGLTWGSVLVRW